MIKNYHLIVYIFFGLAPSLIWLFYYLQKDLHPEPKKMIVKVFLLGMLATIPALCFQIIFSQALENTQFLTLTQWPDTQTWLPLVFSLIKWFLIIALSEEVCMYLVVRLFVYNNDVVDEPLDLMLYMVVSALGFAALENILYLFSPVGLLPFDAILKIAITISFIRFVGATFLHTLSAALIGYCMALSSLRGKHRFRLTILGLTLAVLLHGLYDFSIITLSSPLNFLVPLLIVLGLAVFMLYDFDEIKKVKSICKI